MKCNFGVKTVKCEMLFPHRPGAESADPEQQPRLPPARGELQAADGQQPVQRGRHGRHQGHQGQSGSLGVNLTPTVGQHFNFISLCRIERRDLISKREDSMHQL